MVGGHCCALVRLSRAIVYIDRPSRYPLPSFLRKRESRTIPPYNAALSASNLGIPAGAGRTVLYDCPENCPLDLLTRGGKGCSLILITPVPSAAGSQGHPLWVVIAFEESTQKPARGRLTFQRKECSLILTTPVHLVGRVARPPFTGGHCIYGANLTIERKIGRPAA